MRPIHIFFLFTILVALFVAVSFTFPDHEIVFSDSFRIRIPDMGSLLKPENQSKPEISSLLKVAREIEKEELSPDTTQGNLLNKADSLSLQKNAGQGSSAVDTAMGLEYPGGTYEAMAGFFKALQEIYSTRQGFHILHYGDSQLEGDRVTEYLRTQLQKEFGGSGPGLLPFEKNLGRISFTSSLSDSWNKYNHSNKGSWSKKTSHLGPLASFYKFSPFTKDSTQNSTGTKSAWFRLGKLGRSGGSTQNFTRCRVYFTDRQPLTATLKSGKEILKKDSLKGGKGCQFMNFSFPSAPDEITLNFSSSGSPDFYCLCLDNPAGVSVDNIPLRGSAGLEFTGMGTDVLQTLYSSLHVKLLILQFGANLIAGNGSNFSSYEKNLSAQLKFLKTTFPDLNILVISTADAAHKTAEGYESFTHIEKLVEAQRNAAFANGCAFWNLFNKMGGRNAMVSWVSSTPALGSPDHIHFTSSGARVVAKLLYNDLIHDYRSFCKTNPEKETAMKK